jgi:hypothetical protein
VLRISRSVPHAARGNAEAKHVKAHLPPAATLGARENPEPAKRGKHDARFRPAPSACIDPAFGEEQGPSGLKLMRDFAPVALVCTVLELAGVD